MLGRTPAISPMLAIVAITLFASLGYEAVSRLGHPPIPAIDSGPIVALACLTALAAASIVAIRSSDRCYCY